MRALRRALGVVLVGIFASSATAGAEEALSASLRAVMEEQIAAYNREDADAVLATLHTRSPDYEAMKRVLPVQFRELHARAGLARFQYVGHDDEFAVARVKIRTSAEGRGYAANVRDAMVLFHLEDGVWKFWSDDTIGVVLEP